MNKFKIKGLGKYFLYALLVLCKKLQVTNNEIKEAKIIAPLITLILIPITLVVSIALYYYIRWDFFGITDGINPYYINNFKSSFDSYMWIFSEIGFSGRLLFILITVGYLWMCRKLFLAIFY